MKFTVLEFTLQMKHTFTISRGSRDVNRNIFLKLEHDGVTAWGEASPNTRYGETPESCSTALHRLAASLPYRPDAYVEILNSLEDVLPGEYAAKAAVDMAIMDWLGKSLDVPLYRIWGLDPDDIPPTSQTIGIDTPAKMAERAREARDFPSLKIKLGTSDDRSLVQAIRAVTDRPLRVDANEAWRDREAAVREIDWLAGQGVELVEQPMPADQPEDAAWLKARSPLPLYADEAFRVPRDLLTLREGFHGVNIKLMKCGGLLPAREAVTLARALDMKVMLGCMVESALAIAAGAQLAPLVDVTDLDGNQLIANDPFHGHRLKNGKHLLGDGPGLGVMPADDLV